MHWPYPAWPHHIHFLLSAHLLAPSSPPACLSSLSLFCAAPYLQLNPWHTPGGRGELDSHLQPLPC